MLRGQGDYTAQTSENYECLAQVMVEDRMHSSKQAALERDLTHRLLYRTIKELGFFGTFSILCKMDKWLFLTPVCVYESKKVPLLRYWVMTRF